MPASPNQWIGSLTKLLLPIGTSPDTRLLLSRRNASGYVFRLRPNHEKRALLLN